MLEAQGSNVQFTERDTLSPAGGQLPRAERPRLYIGRAAAPVRCAPVSLPGRGLLIVNVPEERARPSSRPPAGVGSSHTNPEPEMRSSTVFQCQTWFNVPCMRASDLSSLSPNVTIFSLDFLRSETEDYCFVGF